MSRGGDSNTTMQPRCGMLIADVQGAFHLNTPLRFVHEPCPSNLRVPELEHTEAVLAQCAPPIDRPSR